MRPLLVAVAASALLVSPVLAGGLDPSRLVLRQADVPAGFRLDRDESGIRSNEREAKNDPRLPGLFVRWGRLTGYEAVFDRGAATIESRVDVCRRPEGAHMLLLWFDRELRKASPASLRRSPARIGAEGWVYRGKLPVAFTLVVWRNRTAFAGVFATGVSRERTLALARAQQRRIAAALR
jgi:hypothetical protein